MICAYLQEIKEWLQNAIQELDQSDLPPTPKLCVAAVLMCCACRILHSLFNDKTSVALLRMMALPPDGESFKFLGSLMKGKDSRYCFYVLLASSLILFLLFCSSLFQVPSDTLIDCFH